MPHYKDGTKAKIGDIAKGPYGSGGTAVGPVITIYEGETCNLCLGNGLIVYEADGARVVTTFQGGSHINAKDCDKVA